MVVYVNKTGANNTILASLLVRWVRLSGVKVKVQHRMMVVGVIEVVTISPNEEVLPGS